MHTARVILFACAGATAWAQSIQVTSPNGGEVWTPQANQQISWQSDATAGTVEAWLVDGAARFDLLGVVDVAAGQLTVAASPTLPAAANYRILLVLRADANSVTDESDAPFSVAAAPTIEINLTSPNVASVWTPATSQLITWNTNAMVGEIELILRSADSPSVALGRAPASAGEFAFTVCPGIGASTATVTARLIGTMIADDSEPFTILAGGARSLNLTSPPASATVAAGSVVPLAWSAENLTGGFRIVVASAAPHFSVHAVAADTHSIDWLVPRTLPVGSALITVVAGGCDGTATRVSRLITITPPVAPVGDADADGDIDAIDFAAMQRSFTGDQLAILGFGAAALDVEPDGDIDLAEAFDQLSQFTGPMQP